MPDIAADIAAATAPLAVFIEGWNAGDGSIIGSAFSNDARFVNIFGQVLEGRAAITRQHQTILDGFYKGTTAAFPATVTQWLGDTHLLIGCDAELHNVAHAPPGMPPPADKTMRTRMALITTAVPGGWRIVFAQNTLKMG